MDARTKQASRLGMITSIKFRGEEQDVNITHNGGYEEDTNCQDISWEWVNDELNKIDLTIEEEQDIYTQLVEILESDSYEYF